MTSSMSRPRPSFLGLVVLLLGLLALATPTVAAADRRSEILGDCEDDSKLRGSYTPGELRDARDNIPSDKDAYTDCRDVLQAALRASAGKRASESGAGGGGGGADTGGQTGSPPAGGATGGGGGGPDLGSLDTPSDAPAISKSPEEEATLRTARDTLPEVDVRGQRIVPGVRGVAGQAASATVPSSLVVVLVLLGVSALLAAVPFVRRRVLARRTP